MPRDEGYVLDLCDRVLGRVARRQHRFDFLTGDTGRRLPVDAFYPDLKLVIEYRERQHIEDVPFWDGRRTASGMSRGQQRARYDRRRREVLPRHGIELVELTCTEFECARNKRLRRIPAADEAVVTSRLAKWLAAGGSSASAVPEATLRALVRHFHAVIRGRAGRLVDANKLALPDAGQVSASADRKGWFQVSGMYGGFSYQLGRKGEASRLTVESWSRVVGGSGQRHEITARGAVLVDEGFV